MSRKVKKPDEEWRKALTPHEYQILREKGTERPFTGGYWNSKEEGVYRCRACDTPLFTSQTKFDSGTGWPSFTEPVTASNVETAEDRSHFMTRTEVLCSSCGGHLGHLFPDGPGPTGLRYCINSACLLLDKDTEESGEEEG